MFTLPPRPPRGYHLEDVPPTQQSAQEFTPVALPRVTQSNLAKFCSPLSGDEDDDDEPPPPQVQTVVPSVLDKWTNDWRAYWVPKPGENAYLVDEMYGKYRVTVDPDYNPTYKHKPKVFCRSFKYELDCLEEARRQKLLTTMQNAPGRPKDTAKAEDGNGEEGAIGVVPCEHQPPFWWKTQQEERAKKEHPMVPAPQKSEYRSAFLRWQQEPGVFVEKKDACKRREELQSVGQPFRNEAINWYYKNYPPPSIKFRPEKFSK